MHESHLKLAGPGVALAGANNVVGAPFYNSLARDC